MSKVFDPQIKYEISATTTTGNTAISGSYPIIRVYNAGTAVVKLKWGSGAQTATTSDYTVAVAPGAIEAFTKGGADNVAAIMDSGTATVYVNVGVGE
jgi:hypothetical protein